MLIQTAGQTGWQTGKEGGHLNGRTQQVNVLMNAMA
jgi:hypothetical protein